jgi:3-oxoacyl-[acyl-carrier-protein] synthase II
VPSKPQPLQINYALSNSFGFGGTNGSLVFKRWTE